ncbi:hypothetical protein SBV1_2460009 [Verrucomicrobia bacterium]|nr:hypothetical protein SBV1_2460009 [Verrucomicrobiota bacterium]
MPGATSTDAAPPPDPETISFRVDRPFLFRIRLMVHIWNRVPSHCLIVSQPDSGKMKPAVRTLCGLVN